MFVVVFCRGETVLVMKSSFFWTGVVCERMNRSSICSGYTVLVIKSSLACSG